MDQIKVGKFIAACRKEQGMTQANLAEKLGISDRAISKWENGKSMPDTGIMLELCEHLKINVNELLSGEKIMAELYDKRAEENLLEMRRQVEEKNRQLLRTEYLVSFPTVIAGGVHVFGGVLPGNAGMVTGRSDRSCCCDDIRCRVYSGRNRAEGRLL